MFLALGLVLPFLTGQIPQIGRLLLPMHIPVLLCGLICGWQFGAAVGALTPLLRNLIFSAPGIPTAYFMAAELLTYGLVIGIVFGCFRKKNLPALYCSMLIAMLAGRGADCLIKAVVLGVFGSGFSLVDFFTVSFVTALPGILLQLILIPIVMLAFGRAGLIRFGRNG